MTPTRILGQEPAAIVGVCEAALALLLAFSVGGLTDHTVALIMACVTAGMGVAVAFWTHHPALSGVVGLCKAALALAVGYGVALTDTQTAAVIALVTVVGGMFLRTQTSPRTKGTGMGQAT
ncbi:MAG: hypothetical protein ACRDQA_04305 [Nocardioidaceae bacterium]